MPTARAIVHVIDAGADHRAEPRALQQQLERDACHERMPTTTSR